MTSSLFYEESMHGTEQHAGHGIVGLWRVLRMTRRSTCHPERAQKGFREFENSGFRFGFFLEGLFFLPKLYFLHHLVVDALDFPFVKLGFRTWFPFGNRVGRFVAAWRNTGHGIRCMYQYRYGVT